jgi:hypothetical protein
MPREPYDPSLNQRASRSVPAPDEWNFSRMLIANLRHYLNADGSLPDLPEPALNLAFHLGAIVGWVSRFPSYKLQDANVPCRRRPRRRRCLGEIQACPSPNTGTIEWTCSFCSDGGAISGWELGPIALGWYTEDRAVPWRESDP